MKRLLAILLTSPVLAIGAEAEMAAKRDASLLVSCIKVLNIDCILSSTYPPTSVNDTSTKSDLIREITNRYGGGESGTLAAFDLKDPLPEFSGGGKKYVFIPYVKLLWIPGVSDLTQGFLIGVSTDEGMNWKFVDNWRATEEAVRGVFPSYTGQPSIPKGGHTIGHAPALMPR
jgi:hypothetical protein